MGSDRGGDIVPTFGPVTVAPLPPFEWKGVEKIDVGDTELKPLEPAMVFSSVWIYYNINTKGYFELRLQGKNLTPEQFEGQTLNITFDDGSTTVGTMQFVNVEGVDIQYYDVKFDMADSTYNQLTSFRFSPPDNAFEVTCVDLIKA